MSLRIWEPVFGAHKNAAAAPMAAPATKNPAIWAFEARMFHLQLQLKQHSIRAKYARISHAMKPATILATAATLVAALAFGQQRTVVTGKNSPFNEQRVA